MSCKDALLIVFGAALGFGLGILADFVRRTLDRRERSKRTKELLSAILEEVKEGVSRCEGLTEKRETNRVSFSRIYLSLWESSCAELAQQIEALKEPEILRLLHKIYYRFDLVNFNMEREAFESGAAFAAEYLEEMKENLSKLKKLLSKL